MTLRPRYSLLTLLILTALIAGGVKLWYGPHHVVERPTATEELEYTYVRDLQGNRILDGPYVTRDRSSSPPKIVVSFYRQGGWLNWNYSCAPIDHDEPPPEPRPFEHSPFTPAEWQAFHRAVDAEKQRHYPPGTKLSTFEGPVMIDIF